LNGCMIASSFFMIPSGAELLIDTQGFGEVSTAGMPPISFTGVRGHDHDWVKNDDATVMVASC
jgi:hypothetical protein